MSWLLELRIFKVKPGTRDEFDRISREGTIPLMRECGITVLSHGPSLLDENEWYLMRAFPDLDSRVELAGSLYARPEWDANFEGPVSAMIEDYHTALFPAPAQTVKLLTEPGAWDLGSQA